MVDLVQGSTRDKDLGKQRKLNSQEWQEYIAALGCWLYRQAGVQVRDTYNLFFLFLLFSPSRHLKLVILNSLSVCKGILLGQCISLDLFYLLKFNG